MPRDRFGARRRPPARLRASSRAIARSRPDRTARGCPRDRTPGDRHARAGARASGSRARARDAPGCRPAGGAAQYARRHHGRSPTFSASCRSVPDVRENISAARLIGPGGTAIRRRGLDGHCRPERHAALHLVDPDLHALSGDRSGDEHDLAVVARQHPAARCGLLDCQRQGVAGSHINEPPAWVSWRAPGWHGRWPRPASSSRPRATSAPRTASGRRRLPS